MKPTQLNGVMDDLKTQWDNAVNGFRAKEAAFRNAVAELQANKAKYYAAGLQNRYDSLMYKANLLNNTINGALNTVATIKSYFKDTFGLGVIPAIPFATIAGATAAIGVLMAEYYAIRTLADDFAIKRLPPDQQAAARKKLLDQAGFGENFQQTAITLAIIAAAVFLLPQLFKKGK